MTPLLTSDRLVVRRFRPEDVESFVAYRSDPDVSRYQSWSSPLPREAAVETVAQFIGGEPSAPGWFQYAVELPSHGVLIGDIGVRLDDNLMQAEIGFTFAPEFQGRGYATEAAERVLESLFVEHRLRRVSAECDARNTRSAALLTRLGFRQEGLRPAYTWIKGEWTDDMLFGLLAEDWSACH